MTKSQVEALKGLVATLVAVAVVFGLVAADAATTLVAAGVAAITAIAAFMVKPGQGGDNS